MPQFLEEAQKLKALAIKIDAQRRLSEFGTIIKHIENRRAKDFDSQIFVLHLKPLEHKITLYPYSRKKADAAIAKYTETEQAAKLQDGEDVVLVDARSAQELRKAYPNYFMDTRKLVQELDAIKAFCG